MAGILQATLPAAEPVLLAEAINFLKLNSPPQIEQTLIQSLITAARVYCEGATNAFLASRNFVQYRDNFPSFPFLPNPYSPNVFPFGYPMTANYPLWNYGPTPIKPDDLALLAWPVTAISKITYIGQDGDPHDLVPNTDFLVDLASQPARVSPLQNSSWPFTAPSANCVAIYFTAGYGSDPTQITTIDSTAQDPTPPDQIAVTTFATGIPQPLRVAILQLVAHWYFNREAVVAGAPASVPHALDALLAQFRTYNFDFDMYAGGGN